ncbi:hypothetical protein AH03_21 [Erwinia phage AH03]|uniref:Uncharacterized protein n=1 Tax=Erwinia phage AH03 TaxID=2869568 RepID=A0AAE7X0K5_9CAUD|nr:hypothetical protein AH03_21 [Erwinia phage AH03]
MKKIGIVTILETNHAIGPLIVKGRVCDVLIDDCTTNPTCVYVDFMGYRSSWHEAISAGVKLSKITEIKGD